MEEKQTEEEQTEEKQTVAPWPSSETPGSSLVAFRQPNRQRKKR